MHDELHVRVEGLGDPVAVLGLLDGARVPVEHVSAAGGRVDQRLPQHAEDDLVRDEVPMVHVATGDQASLAAQGDLPPQ